MQSKNVGKKLSQKRAKTRFLYSHEYRDQKMGGKTRNTNFYRNIRIVRKKMLGKKRLKKSAKISFLYLHVYIVTKKWGEKKHETIFPEKHE